MDTTHPPYIVEKPDASATNQQIFSSLWSGIRAKTGTAKSPIVAGILQNPEIVTNSGLRQEVMSLVFRSLVKLGFAGTGKGARMESLFARLLKEKQEGGDI